jgi:MoaA/NifB/PqqE/SkfB family radical SAM enzyme
VLTNGSLLTAARGQELIAAGAAGFVVSLDSLQDDVYHLVRGRPLTATLRGLEVLAGLKQAVPNLIACATAVITRHNADQLGQLAAYLAERRLGFQVQPCLDAPDEEVDAQDVVSMAAVRLGLEALREQYAGRLDAAEQAYLAHIPDYLASRQLPTGHRCLAAYAVVHISADLNLFPCWLLPPVGNLRQASLAELWQSSAMSAVRERIQAGNCPGCWLLCDAKPSLTYRHL